MKLLICTQAVDQNSPTLGFFHEWIATLAPRFDSIEVICLYKGEYDLAENVRIHSLGKEQNPRRFKRFRYASRLISLAWKLRKQYDSAFVHMNEEYILLAGWLWKSLGKRSYMWRNHYAGSWRTDVAAAFCTKVFCTSRYSYTAKYHKTMFMPVGVDTSRFSPDPSVIRKERSILFLARMSPSKNPAMLLEALRILYKKNIQFTATFVGSPLPEHEAYYGTLIEHARNYGVDDIVSFIPAVAHDRTSDFYHTHEIFVNCSLSGMFDKTLFEAMACGCFVIAPSKDLALITDEKTSFTSTQELAEHLTSRLARNADTHGAITEKFQEIVISNSLDTLAIRLQEELSK